MINTMLEISEAEAGLAPSAKEIVDVAGVVQTACELFRPIAKDKNVTLISRIPGSVPLSGDIHGLQRMVVNILDNAIKYTPTNGTVTVSLDELNSQIVITFQDTGIGISEEDLPHVFRRLYRCEPSRSQPGFGLGLSLALAMARAHGGNITVTSVLGKGSTFTVILPR
jgi:signal transduction histidine kinase